MLRSRKFWKLGVGYFTSDSATLLLKSQPFSTATWPQREWPVQKAAAIHLHCRCNESVQRIEQCPLGSVWLCSVAENCKRTYLSHRDLQAHINHRHKPAPPPNVPPILPHPLVLPPVSVVGTHPPITVPPPPLLPPRPEQYLMVSAPHSVAPPTSAPMPNIRIPQTTLVNSTVSARPSNLITIQIQDDQSNIASPNAYPPPPPPPPRRPLNQPQLLPQSRDPHHPPPQQPPRRF